MKNIRNWMLFAMVLLFFDVHIGIVNLLPNWAGYLILAYCAKKMMAEKGGLTAALGICAAVLQIDIFLFPNRQCFADFAVQWYFLDHGNAAVLRLGYRHFAAAGKRRSMDPAKNIIDVVCHFHCSLRYDAECKTNVHPCGRYDVLCQTLFSVWDLAFDSERRSRTRKRRKSIRKRYSWNP